MDSTKSLVLFFSSRRCASLLSMYIKTRNTFFKVVGRENCSAAITLHYRGVCTARQIEMKFCENFSKVSQL